MEVGTSARREHRGYSSNGNRAQQTGPREQESIQRTKFGRRGHGDRRGPEGGDGRDPDEVRREREAADTEQALNEECDLPCRLITLQSARRLHPKCRTRGVTGLTVTTYTRRHTSSHTPSHTVFSLAP